MNRHEGLKNCGLSMKWKEQAMSRMLLAMIKKRANSFFMIVQRKVLKAAETFVTTVKGLTQGKHLEQQITLSIWQLPWVLIF